MKTIQTIAGFSAHSGGTSTCTYDLLSAMHCIGCHVDLMTLASTGQMGKGEEWIKALPNDAVTPYGYTRNMKRWLCKSDYDIYHTNGLWMHCNHITCATARKKGKPYIITPHGMLYPDALHRSYWKKWPLMKLFFNKDIADATCLHVTCKQEMEHVRSFGYKGTVAVIPNPANLPEYLDEVASVKPTFLGCSRVRKLGFLGRLHPRKKVENLLYGVAKLPGLQDCELVIMGKGDDKYEQFLRDEAIRLGLKNVTFCGFVSGREKYEQLMQLSCLFVPSDFENFGMIVTEALSVGTPVMASLGTPWEELNTVGCGWWIDRSPDNIAQVMRQVIEIPTEKLLAMGERGRQLVQEKYAAPQVAAMMKRLYEWILNGGEKPGFVYE
jgi:glycosyltransferase, family 1